MKTEGLKKIIAVIFIVVLAALAYWYAGVRKPPQSKPLPQKENQQKVPPVIKKTLIGSYASYTKNKLDSPRQANINLTISLINNKIVKPGEEFSFNDTVGAVTTARGFKAAQVYDDYGHVQPGLGGGMCQVTSTLYNAALNAGLLIVERHPHSKSVTYVPEGRDATVSDDKDFRFQNNKNREILIQGLIENHKVTVNIYQLSTAK